MPDQTPNPNPSPEPADLGTAPVGPPTQDMPVAGDTLAGSGTDTQPGSTEPTANDSIAAEPGNDSVSGDDTTGSDTTPAELTTASYDSIKLPEGMTADDALLGQFKEIALEAKLDPTVAQKLVDLQASSLKAQQDAAMSAFNTMSEGWQAETLATPEFQGENKDKSLAAMARVMDEFGSAELKQVFNDTGVGNNPHLVKMLLNFSKIVSEGEPSRAGNPAGTKGPRTAGQILYGNSNQQT